MYEGERYQATKDLTVKEVVEMIRQDLKVMVEMGSLPAGLKFSIKRRGHKAFYITVRKLGEGMEGWGEQDLKLFCRRLVAVADRYNRDDSRIEVDHFDTRFYAYADFSPELKNR